MITSDSLQRFIFDEAPIRGEIVRLSQSYQTIIQQRVYPPVIKRLLSEALVACSLLIDTIKFNGELSLQFQGDAKVFPLLLVQVDSNLNIRGFAQFTQGLEPEQYQQAFLKGRLALNLHFFKPNQNYQSIIPITSLSMADNLMNYFAHSEQISTQIWIHANDNTAAGMLLQLMPGKDSYHREQFWEYAIQLGQTLSIQELLELDNQTLLYRLYHETKIRLFNPQAVNFQCRCGIKKMQQLVKMLGKEDALALIAEQEKIDITCDFCNKHYYFDAIDVTLLFHKL